MQHRVETEQVGDLDVADVLQDGGDLGISPPAQGVALVEIDVQAYDFVPRRLQHRSQNRSDISPVARYEYSDRSLLQNEPGALAGFPELLRKNISRAQSVNGYPKALGSASLLAALGEVLQ